MYFLRNGSPIAAPTIQRDQNGEIVDGSVFMSTEFLPFVLDMLRNEKVLKAFLSAVDPSMNGIST